MRLFKSKAIEIVISLVVVLFFVYPMFSANNVISPGKIDLIVYVNYDEPNLNSWKPVFEEFSKKLYNATEKQLQLGKVEISRCNFSKEKADIWINASDGCAYAPVLAFGIPNEHMTIYESHKDTSGTIIGQFGLVQAFSHYAFGLFDEHRGKINGAGDWLQNDMFFCVSNDDPVASIMDGGSSIAIKNKRTEFCTDPDLGWATSHQPGYTDANGDFYETAQELLNGEDSWSTIVRNSNLAYPSAEPTDDISGYEPIEFNIIEPGTRLDVCIDRSGSMWGDKIALAKEGADIFVDLAHFGENMAATSYAYSGRVDYAMQELVDQQDKDNAKQAIDQLVADGATSIGSGLRTSLNEITDNGNNPLGCAEVIVLLSDGRHNYGESPYSVLPDIIARGVKVYTIGLGSDVDDGLMSDIAFQTGGTYHFAADGNELAQIFSLIYAKTRAEDVYHTTSSQIAANELQSDQTLVDQFTNEITFELNYPDQSDMDFNLTTPSGTVIDPSSAGSDIEYVKGSAHQYYRIKNPETGQWTTNVQSGAGNNALTYNMVAFGHSDIVSTYAGSNKSVYSYPDPVIITASVTAGEAVTGVDVTGVVLRPDNSTTTIRLMDDGSSANGDKIANDGIYSAIFDDFGGAGDGSYTFTITMHNEHGQQLPKNRLPFVEEGCTFSAQDIPEFVREETFSTVINDVPKELVMKELDMDYTRINFNNTNRLVFQGNFVLNDNSNGFNPINENVTFEVGDFSETIPVNSFRIVDEFGQFKLGHRDTTIYLYESTAGDESMYIVTVDGHTGMFGYAGYGMDMLSTYFNGPDDVPLGLQIGDDKGENTMDMVEVFPKIWVYGKRIRLPEQYQIMSADGNAAPLGYELQSNYPNPFNPQTEISYTLPEKCRVSIDVYDMTGRLVKTLFSGQAAQGEHQVVWKGVDNSNRTVSSGIYIYKLRAVNEDGQVHSFYKKMMLLR